MKLFRFCEHKWKKLRVIKEIYPCNGPALQTWSCVCEKCGKYKNIKNY